MLLDDMLGKFNSTDEEVKEAANFAGCYMYGERWDVSDLAFESCYGDKTMLNCLKDKDAEDATGFIEQMIQLWDKDVKFSD